MTEPLFPDPPRPPGSDWSPMVRDRTVHVGLAPHQWLPFVLVAAIAAAIASISLLPGLPGWVLALLASGITFVVPWYVFGRVGVELDEQRVTVRGVRGDRVLHTGEIAAVDVAADGHVVFDLRGGERVVSLAPRRTDNLFDDRAVDDKVALIRRWLIDDGASVLADLGRPRIAAAVVPAPPTAPPAPPAPPTAGGAAPEGPAAASRRPLHSSPTDPVADDRDVASAADASVSLFPLATVKLVALFTVAALVGYLFVGRDVLVLAIAMLVLLRFGRDPGRPLALAAFLLLIIAAVASIMQEFPPLLVVNYANRRPTATEAGAIVGVFLVLSTVIFAVTERSPQQAPWRPLFRTPDREAILYGIARARRILARAWPYLAAGGAGIIVRLVLSPPAVPTVYAPLLDNLRLGTGYSLVSPSGSVPFGDTPPLGVGLVAFFPLGAGTALWSVGLATIAAVGWYAHRRWGRHAAIVATFVAAVLPSLWAQQIAIQLAGLLILCGVAFVDPFLGRSSVRSVLAGMLLGGAVLARPDAVVALVVVVVWLVALDRGGAWRDVIRVLVGAVVVVAPWANFVWSNFGAPWLAGSFAAMLNDPASTTKLGYLGFAISAGAIVVVLAALRDSLDETVAWLPFVAIPLGAASLAVSDLGHRDVLGWSAPLAAVIVGHWLAERWHEPLSSAFGADDAPPQHAVGRDPAGAPSHP